MQLLQISKPQATDQVSYRPASAVPAGYVKIFACGELIAEGDDHKLLVRVNGLAANYRSYVLMEGDAAAGEWDVTGFFAGRNGWHQGAALMMEYTLASFPTSQIITGTGLSTFKQDHGVLGFESHGSVDSSPAITSIDVLFLGGLFTGDVRFYLL